MSGYVNYKYRDGNPPAHTKRAFENHNVLTVHSIIVKNALIDILLYKVKHMPSLLPKSIKELFPNNIPSLKSTYDDCADWLSTYNNSTFRSSIFYKGPMLSITKQNTATTIPSNIFSLNVFKSSEFRKTGAD